MENSETTNQQTEVTMKVVSRKKRSDGGRIIGFLALQQDFDNIQTIKDVTGIVSYSETIRLALHFASYLFTGKYKDKRFMFPEPREVTVSVKKVATNES